MMEFHDTLPLNQESLRALRALLRKTPRAFSVNFAVCDDSGIQERAISALKEDFEALNVVTLPPGTHDPFGYVKDHVQPAPRDGVLITGLDDVLGSERDLEVFFAALNASPRRWKAWFAVPVVIWISEAADTAIRHRAPDFWEWHESRFDFTTP